MFSLTTFGLVCAFAMSTLAQNSSTMSTTTSLPSTTVTNLFFGGGVSATDYKWGGSVVGAGTDATTYAVNCVADCGTVTETITLIEGSSIYSVSSTVATPGGTGSFTDSCSLAGTTSAVCVEVVSVSAQGTSTSIKTTVTISPLTYVPVTVTAGVSKLASPTSSPTGAAAGLRVGGNGRSGEWVVLVALPVVAAAVGGFLILS